MSSPRNIIRGSLEDCPALEGQLLAYIGVGSNLASEAGDPVQTLQQAVLALAALTEQPMLVSSLWESTPLDCPPDSPRFLNAVVALAPGSRSPMSVLRSLQAIENDFGRLRTGVRNAPRTLDLDLLSYGDLLHSDEVLTLPHPRMHERRFVLQPLLEIAPTYVVPGMSCPARLQLEKIAPQGKISPIKCVWRL